MTTAVAASPTVSRVGSGIALALTSMLLWGGQFPVGKSALAVLDGYHLTLFRFALALAIMVPILVATEGLRAFAPSRQVGLLAVLGVIGMTISPVLTFVGTDYSGPEHAAIILALQPSIIAIGHWITSGQRPVAFTIGCIIAAFVGVALVITKGEWSLGATSMERWGDFLILIASFTWVIYVLGVERFRGWSAMRLTTLSGLAGLTGTAVLALLAEQLGWGRAPSFEAVTSVAPQIVYLALGGVVVAMLTWNLAVQRLGAIDAMLYQNLIPVVNFVIGHLQGHRFAPIELAGAGLVIGALAANSLYLRARRRSSG